MAQALLFLREGFFHIVSIYSLDHLLFLLALVAIYQLKDWKEMLALASAFTAAHAISLLFSILNWITIPNAIIEWIIALTIFYTCIENLYLIKFKHAKIYIVACFGLIHGIGFSQTLMELFMGMEYNPWNTLLPFNIGVEIGQVLVLLLFMIIIHLIGKVGFFNQKKINQMISIPVAMVSLFWLFQRNIF
ncbi:MAG: hypothetical protein RI952_379 [Bacteroidota bacterium]|jgi:hypothetical protein